MGNLADCLAETASLVRTRWKRQPSAGIILGSGLGKLADHIELETDFDYAELPHFIGVSALGHHGRLVCGLLADRPVMAFQGRFHLYEGCTPQQAALPVRLLQALGCPRLVASNAAGGLNPQYAVGDLMLIDDHINLMFANPLVGPNEEQLGPRFPDMSMPYDAELMQVAQRTARSANIPLHRGVYVAMCGPAYETRAEYRLCRRLGGDAVGMSTVPEVLAARHAGMRVVGFSTITNVGSPDAPAVTSGHDVVKAAAGAGDKLMTLVRGVVGA